jgi:hypothetical protein
MRWALIVMMVVATPASACGFDGMFGFNHYADAGADAGAAEAMREAAIAEARDKFMARYGMVEAADTGAAADAVVVAGNAAGPDTAPQ